MTESAERIKHPGGRPPSDFPRVEAGVLRMQGRSYREIAKHFKISKSLAARELRNMVPVRSPAAPESTLPVQPSPVVIEPMLADADADIRPVDSDEERRTDLAPRTPGRIAYLLNFETEAQTRARIENDWRRVAYRRG